MIAPHSQHSSPFDELAEEYDRRFSQGVLGILLRRAVWRWLDECFQPGQHVLELNCGTGEDAVYLGRRGVQVLATDNSPAMLEAARAKVVRAELESVVELLPLAIEDLLPETPLRLGPFDGVLSNFGGLNCVADLRGVAAGLASNLRPGAAAVLCLMGPIVPWEWIWFLVRGQPAKAFRRLRRGGSSWRGLTVHYPSIGAVRRAFAPGFHFRRAAALGALLPPAYVEEWAARHPRLLAWLERWERRLESFPGLPWLADHYLLHLQRR